jgi:hypothetical protein
MERLQLISVVIPALNEESGIKKTLSSIPKKKLSDQGYDLEIIVIDGNSNDLTRDVAQTMGAKIILEKRMGYGIAYKSGLSRAKGDIIVTLDADGSYPAQLIPDYIRQLNEKKLDFITVNRFSKMDDGAMSLTHRIGNKILSFTMRLLYSIDVRDSQSGMWVMRKRFIERINLESNDFSFSEEIKIIAFKFFEALELDGTYYRRAGEVKLKAVKDGWNNLKYLFRYRSLIGSALKPVQDSFEKEGF